MTGNDENLYNKYVRHMTSGLRLESIIKTPKEILIINARGEKDVSVWEGG